MRVNPSLTIALLGASMLAQILPLAPRAVAATEDKPDAQRIYDLGPGVTPPRPTSAADPYFPQSELKRRRVDITCELAVVVDERGEVRDVRVTRSGGEAFDKSAITAVKQWTFFPGTKDGKPVSVRMPIEISFRAR